MWARVIEVMLGCWLALSPFIFRHGPGETFLWVNDFAVGAFVIAVALLACWPRAEKLRLLNLAAGVYLIIVAFVSAPPPPPPPYQNHAVVGILLLIVAIIPSRAMLPPRSWQAFYEERAARQER